MRRTPEETRPIAAKRELPKWVDWSLTPHSEEEIREAVFNTPELICWSYICKSSVLSEEFIEELLVLSTGLFDGVRRELYNEENINMIKEILYIEPTPARKNLQKAVAEKYLRNMKDNSICDRIIHLSNPIRSRVDWYQIASFQDITPQFKKKFRVQFLKAKINSEAKFKENKLNA